MKRSHPRQPGSCVFAWVALLCLSGSAPARAQSDAAEPPSTAVSNWSVGAYYRYTWVPGAIFAPFYERAPSIVNHGFGLIAEHRFQSGMRAEIGLGYMPYRFAGVFTENDAVIEDTEYVRSKLALLHATGSLLWPIRLHRMLTLELGVGIDFGAIIGRLKRSEAYPDKNGVFRACDGPLMPATTGPDDDESGDPIPFCEQPLDANGKPIATNPPDVAGGHYGITERRVPPIMLVPMLPHLALRFEPHERIAIKLEAAFGLAQLWIGASVRVGLGTTPAKPQPAAAAVDIAEPAKVTTALGRVVGKVMESGSNLPIARASVKTPRSFSALQTNVEGLFVFERLDPGPMHLEIEHPDYAAGSCDTVVPERGGDVFVHCFLTAQPSAGAISGQVKDEQGKPISGAHVEVTGPVGSLTTTQPEGLFALPDAPAGDYRVRVEANGYLIQLVEFEVQPRETATPQIILLKKAATAMVKRVANELALTQQVAFEPNSAQIAPSSERLLREIADLLLRNRELTRIEIQGHTDDSGGPELNQTLSQARAEAVRDWLVRAGIDANRLQARGYGQTKPLRANDTPENRAKNRRVQFIVLPQ